MATRSSSLFALLSMFFAASAVAVPVEDLYVAEVLVPRASQTQLASGAREGLLEVLVRVSGTTEVSDSPVIRQALSRPQNYYYQYSFESPDEPVQSGDAPEEEPDDDDREAESTARILRIYFEPSAIARLLREGGFNVWGSNRPSILLWVAVSDGQGRRLLGETDDSELVQSFNRQARRRGLPLMYPLLDLEDEANLSPAAVWGFFLGRVADASQRYNPDSILTGRVSKIGDDRWSAHWSYFIEERWISVDSTASSIDALVEQVIDRLADNLVSRYAIGSSRGFVWMRVESVDGLEEYAAVSGYLENLLPVLDSQVVEVSGNEVLYRLSTEGQSRQLVEIIELDKKMVLMNPSAVDRDAVLKYRWLD